MDTWALSLRSSLGGSSWNLKKEKDWQRLRKLQSEGLEIKSECRVNPALYTQAFSPCFNTLSARARGREKRVKWSVCQLAGLWIWVPSLYLLYRMWVRLLNFQSDMWCRTAVLEERKVLVINIKIFFFKAILCSADQTLMLCACGDGYCMSEKHSSVGSRHEGFMMLWCSVVRVEAFLVVHELKVIKVERWNGLSNFYDFVGYCPCWSCEYLCGVEGGSTLA